MNLSKALWAGVLLLFPFSSYSQKSEVFVTKEGAIRGRDPVAYFTEGKAVPGVKEWTYAYQGASWYFSTQENRDAFASDPLKYAPQYGGYCAYGMAEGHKAPTQPEAWTIVDGKLYLNYNIDVRTMWRNDQKGFIEKATTNWPKIKDE